MKTLKKVLLITVILVVVLGIAAVVLEGVRIEQPDAELGLPARRLDRGGERFSVRCVQLDKKCASESARRGMA